MVSAISCPFKPFVVDFTMLNAFAHGGKLSLSSTLISMFTSSSLMVLLVSTTLFSFITTSSVMSWSVLLITTCLNLQWAWWMFNLLRDLKSWSHKVHVWTVFRTRQTVRYKLFHENFFFYKNGCKVHFNSQIYKFLVILVNITASCCLEFPPVCVLKSYILRAFS